MSSSGRASPPPMCIDASVLRAAYRRALRTGKFWRLRPEERAILRLSLSFSRIRSPPLVNLLLQIMARISPSTVRRVKALSLGLQVLEERVRQALRLGYYHAIRWLHDLRLALQIGLSLLNTPKAYWPISGGA